MSEWKAKRFWTNADVVPVDAGHGVSLDGRDLRTPGKAPMILPSIALARAVADEWQAQGEVVNPVTMPATRAANTAIDRVTHHHAEVVSMLAAFGDSDLLCYRAEAPQALIARQTDLWDPLLNWADATFGARLLPRAGVMHAPQDATALARLRDQVAAFDAFRLTGFHDLVTLSGSLVLALAVARDRLAADEGWALSRLDEAWQAEQWGEDDDARDLAEIKRAAFHDAKRFFDLSGAADGIRPDARP